MSRVLLFSGTSWASLLKRKNEWLGKAEGGAEDRVVFVIPPDWELERKSEIVKNCLPGYSVFTTEELIEQYLRQSLRKYREDFFKSILLSRHSTTYLLDSILKQAAPDSLSELLSETGQSSYTPSGYLNIETCRQGYVKALSDFIHDFRQSHHEDLLTILNSFKRGKLSTKERDLIDIHDEYENLLNRQELYDYHRGVMAFSEDPEQEAKGSTLVIMGFSHISSLDHKLLLCLVSRFKKSIILQCRNPKASGESFRIQRSLTAFVKAIKEKTEDACRDEKSVLLPLAELMFHDDKRNRLLKTQSYLNIIRAGSRFSEVTQIARHIRKLNSEGIPCNQIRIIFPNYELYTALLMEVFPSYGIPYRLPKGTPLKLFPLAGIIQNLISHSVSPNPFPIREKIFSSPYLSFSCLVDADSLYRFAKNVKRDIPIDKKTIDTFLPKPRTFELDYPGCLELQTRAARVVKSKEKLEPIQLVVQYLSDRYSESPLVRDREMLKTLTDYYVLSKAEKSLYAWQSQMTPSDFCRAVNKLIEIFYIEENACSMNAEQIMSLEDNAVKSKCFNSVADQDKQVMDTIRRLLEKLKEHFHLLSAFPAGATAPDSGHCSEKKFPLLNLVSAFSGLMSDPELTVPSHHRDGIVVFASSDIPICFYPVTFIGGLVDGEFPAKEPFNFLAPRNEGRSMQGDFMLVDRERQNLYQIIASTIKRLFISFPFYESGRKLLVSPFVAEIERCMSFPPAGERSGDTKEVLESPDDCYTTREKLIFSGRNIDRSYEKAIPVFKEVKVSFPEYLRHVISVFRCDGLRGRPNELSRFDGIFESSASIDSSPDSTPAVKKIREQLGDGVVFKVEQLERFAGCPLRFLFDDLMRLKPDYLIDYHPDKTDRGLLIKRILTDYSREAAVKNRGIPDNSGQVMHAIAEKAFEQMLVVKEDLFNRSYKNGIFMGLADPEDPVSQAQKRPGLLASFLENEKNAPDRISPYLTKLELGDFKVEDIPVNITVERVDITSNDKFLIIYNFSISDLGYLNGIHKGLKFKLPLMILALRDYLKDRGIDKRVGGAGTYLVRNPRMIKRGGYFALKRLQASRKGKVSDEQPLFSGQRRYGFLPSDNFEQELTETAERVRHINELIRRGCFNPPLCAVKDQTCLNCSFVRICRKDQLRLDRIYTLVGDEEVYKPRRRMEPLE